MIEPILVCPFDKKLLDKLKRRKLVIHTNDFNDLPYLLKEVSRSIDLHALKIQTEKPLSTIDFEEKWASLPVVIYSTDFGEFRDIMPQLGKIRKSNVRIFLLPHREHNFTGLRILSSLQISCGIYFNGESPDWSLMNDLMHYAIYGRTPHAPLEPFDWLVSHYHPADYTDYDFVYFNNPAKYLHINEKEQIALTETDLLNGNFIGEGIDSLDSIEENRKYNGSLNFRNEIMLRMNECAFCSAFRICLAKFSDLPNKKDTCKVFFSDFLDAADYYYSIKSSKGKHIWQL